MMEYSTVIYLLILAWAVGAWLKAFIQDNRHPDYDYCHGCTQGFCCEEPKSKHCKKWRDEHET